MTDALDKAPQPFDRLEPVICSQGGVPYNNVHIEYWKRRAVAADEDLRLASRRITELEALQDAAAEEIQHLRDDCATAHPTGFLECQRQTVNLCEREAETSKRLARAYFEVGNLVDGESRNSQAVAALHLAQAISQLKPEGE